MALCGYRPGAWDEARERAKTLPVRLVSAPKRLCAVCLGPFEPAGPRLYTCSHDCAVFLRKERKRKADAERMKRLRQERKGTGT